MRTTNFYFNANGSLHHTDDAETAIFRCRAWVKPDKDRSVLQYRHESKVLYIYRNEETKNPNMMIWRPPTPSEIPDHIKMMKLIGAI